MGIRVDFTNAQFTALVETLNAQPKITEYALERKDPSLLDALSAMQRAALLHNGPRSPGTGYPPVKVNVPTLRFVPMSLHPLFGGAASDGPLSFASRPSGTDDPADPLVPSRPKSSSVTRAGGMGGPAAIEERGSSGTATLP